MLDAIWSFLGNPVLSMILDYIVPYMVTCIGGMALLTLLTIIAVQPTRKKEQ